MLRENTAGYDPKERCVSPIVGFSCWALAYVDPGYRRVGCLLHPARNGGADLRYRVGYGEKCRRETCTEVRIFLKARVPARLFWLQLTAGLDSFAYSSRRENPLFHLLGWGSEILERIAREHEGEKFDRDRFLQTYPFFTTGLAPRAVAYLLTGLVQYQSLALLRDKAFPSRFEEFSSRLTETLKSASMGHTPDTATHRLGLDGQFLDFLRLFLGTNRISEEGAARLKRMVDEAVKRFSHVHW